MSVVGCSGEEFASILKALGFRRERGKLVVAPAAEAAAPASGDAQAGQEPSSQEAQTDAFEEIWRPAKRKEARHHDKRTSRKPKHGERARAPKRERQRPQVHQARPERKRAVEHSPFAALEALRGRLVARQSEGS
jgi:ATP-dependent RNA helicase SUPV3L1/SUV3